MAHLALVHIIQQILIDNGESILNDDGVDEEVCENIAKDIVEEVIIYFARLVEDN